MNPFEELERDHFKIKEMLKELEVIIESEELNYPNLLHTLKELTSFWEIHEWKEEILFKKLHSKGFKIPVTLISFEHGELRKQFSDIKGALAMGSGFRIKGSLENSGRKLIATIRKHMDQEDWLLQGLSWEGLSTEIKNYVLSN